ncbi:MAG: hypothetical protein R6W97_00555 [Thiobacillus sp.]
MKQYAHTLVVGSLAALFSITALADHNSVNEAGWANMPNDIHNTRIEDDLSSTAFRDFVSKGEGADSVNRYLDSTSTLSGAGSATTARGGSRR